MYIGSLPEGAILVRTQSQVSDVVALRPGESEGAAISRSVQAAQRVEKLG
jgi:hypothetical protein